MSEHAFEQEYPCIPMESLAQIIMLAQSPEEGRQSSQSLFLAIQLSIMCVMACNDNPQALMDPDDVEGNKALKKVLKHYMPILIRFAKGIHESGGCPETGYHKDGGCGAQKGTMVETGGPESILPNLLERLIKGAEMASSPEFKQEVEKLEKAVAEDMDMPAAVRHAKQSLQNVLDEAMNEVEAEIEKVKKKSDGWTSGPSMN